jgi:predicted RNA-binding protein YlqC (UPF0109 family)
MVKDFIYTYSKMIANYPKDISVKMIELDPKFYEVQIKAHSEDMGKLIGKNGNMINALKTIINGCKAKDGISYKIQIDSI